MLFIFSGAATLPNVPVVMFDLPGTALDSDCRAGLRHILGNQTACGDVDFPQRRIIPKLGHDVVDQWKVMQPRLNAATDEYENSGIQRINEMVWATNRYRHAIRNVVASLQQGTNECSFGVKPVLRCDID